MRGWIRVRVWVRVRVVRVRARVRGRGTLEVEEGVVLGPEEEGEEVGGEDWGRELNEIYEKELHDEMRIVGGREVNRVAVVEAILVLLRGG